MKGRYECLLHPFQSMTSMQQSTTKEGVTIQSKRESSPFLPSAIIIRTTVEITQNAQMNLNKMQFSLLLRKPIHVLILILLAYLPSKQAKGFSPISSQAKSHSIFSISKEKRFFPTSFHTYLRRMSMTSYNSSRNDHENATVLDGDNPVLSLINWREFPKDYDDNLNDKTSSYPFDYQTTLDCSSWSREQYLTSLQRYNEFISSQDSYIAPLLQEALETLVHAYRLYGPKNVIGSFNGGKDAVVIMELIKAAHAKYYHDLLANNEKDGGDDDDERMIKPRMIYFNDKLEFPQVYDFVRTTVQNYDLEMIAFDDTISFVNGLDILVKRNVITPSSSASPNPIPMPMSFVLGTRKADPNAGGQGLFAPSSTWMPPFMRVNPILNWTYGHTWHFLRLFKIPYCVLYDMGYTSLGNVQDTLPCPALLKVKVDATKNDDVIDELINDENDRDGDDSCDYWPAYMLQDWDQERAGRLKKEKKKEKKSSSESSNSKDEIVSQSASNKINVQSNKTPNVSVDTSINNASSCEPVQQSTNDDDDRASFSSVSTVSQRTVGLLIIGDEILKGCTVDSNSHSAALALKANNVPLTKVSVVSDDLDEIVQEIEYMSSNVDVIITSGGVGPTHDDVTIKSVGKALDSAMIFNKNMAELLLGKMNDEDEKELTEAQIKMSTLPECSKLRYLSNDQNEWPVLQCRNIFILPGVPQFFEKKVELVASYLSTELERSVQFKVVLSIDENSIVPILNRVVDNHPNVSFGSYPFVNHPEFKTVVTLEGRRVEGGTFRNSRRYLFVEEIETEDKKTFEDGEIDLNVKLALADLVNGMPEGSVLRVDNNNDLTFI